MTRFTDTQQAAVEDEARIPAQAEDGTKGYYTPAQMQAAFVGGSDGQLQYNADGGFGGMAGSTWDAANQHLTIAGKDYAPSWGSGATVTIDKTRDQSCLDLTPDNSGMSFRIRPKYDWSGDKNMAGSPRLYINDGCGFYSQAWMVISGAFTGKDDTLRITHPSDDPFMLGLWADVQTAFQTRVFNAADGRHWTALERTGKYVFAMEEYGNIKWANSAATYAGFDTGLSRTDAKTLAVGNGTAGDASGTLKVKRIVVGADNVTFTNNFGPVQFLADGTTPITVFNIDTGNNLSVGGSALAGHMQFVVGAGRQFRFLNNNVSRRLLSMYESTGYVTIGNSDQTDGTLLVHDNTATTGDTLLTIRDGAARAARLRFGASGSYDVGFARNAAGVLAITDASTTLSNFRDLKLRNALVNGASDVGGGVGVVALANAGTVPSTNPRVAACFMPKVARSNGADRRAQLQHSPAPEAIHAQCNAHPQSAGAGGVASTDRRGVEARRRGRSRCRCTFQGENHQGISPARAEA